MRNAPRLEIDLKKIEHNARMLVERLALKGISVTGVTKAVLGSTEVCETLIKAGVTSLGDSRIENIKEMCGEHLPVPLILIRSPMLSQLEQVVDWARISFNTEIKVIEQLSYLSERNNKIHEIVLMVELGDLREGIMPKDLINIVRKIIHLPNIHLKGIGSNLACNSGVIPDDKNMAELSSLADMLEDTFKIKLEFISGGNSANLSWAFNVKDTGRINNIRIGEAIFLGCDPLDRKDIEGLHSDAITLIAEVIESKPKPSMPWGGIAQTAFGIKHSLIDRGIISQSILAIGLQDTDAEGLTPPVNIQILGSSSDHIILETDLPLGSEVKFGLNYSAMLRAMTSPFITKEYLSHDTKIL